jgi:hypothetical protein
VKNFAVILSVAVLGFVCDASAQSNEKLFFEGDMVRGEQPGAPGPICVLTNQYMRLEKVVFRVRVRDQAGNALDDKGIKGIYVELSDGHKVPGRFGPHPPPRSGPATDHFWSAVWIIPKDYPSGTLVYKVVATDLQGNRQTWEPFNRVTSQLQVIPGEIEIKKP